MLDIVVAVLIYKSLSTSFAATLNSFILSGKRSNGFMVYMCN